ncbi:LuxR C-terminal-related transcriptional regulator [Microbacterium elymi]|uniref:LuxR C-terminal-related transcriptional regulator n=1 Tax=Microbacterium elymi TaxID=2909587 RepID=A0ABY5NL66_9MICO|nr:LuxR C-terminal-related transcriptional regulator [Microbacterium elymi]UUT35902.1 LuxR C-terminal-related transcriptional regulator [Microbacterium elymi]
MCRYFQESGRTVHLVVDDAHRAQDALTGGLLGALIENAPETLRIILVGTSLLEVSMSRMLLTDPGAMVGTDTLGFTAAEVETLVTRESSTLPPADVIRHTQGWPIAVRLMLVGGVAPDGALESQPSMDNRLHDYVQRHVLGALPADLATFILHTTICTDIGPELAAELSGRDDAADLLEHCATHGLFLDRYERSVGPAYRWNLVFARQCTALLGADDPALLRELHQKAAEVLTATEPLRAVSHFLRAERPEDAVRTLLFHWVRLVVGTEAPAVELLCARLPDPYADDPRVLLVRACAQDVLGQHTMARTLFARASSRLAAEPGLEGSAEVMMLARLFLIDDRADAAEASAQVRRLLESSVALGTSDRAALLYVVGWAELRHRMNPTVVAEFLETAAVEAEASGNTVLRRRALGQLVLARAWAGHMRQAQAVLRRVGDDDEELAVPWIYYAGGGRATGEGWVQYWAGDLDAAYDSFFQVIASGSARTSFGGVARMMLAAAAAGSRDPRRCRRAAAELQTMANGQAQGVLWSAFRDTAIALLEEAAGHRDRAMAIARHYLEVPDLPFVGVALSGILRRTGDLPAALHILQRQRAYAEVSYIAVATRVTAALLQEKRGDAAVAHELCEAALDIAAAEGIRLPFCDGDLSVRRLLTAHIVRSTAHEAFIAECLTQPRGDSMLDQLSERESAVFALLQTAKTLSEIGEDLGVSVNTIKSHQRAIYRKLEVSSRREVRLLVP